MQARAVLRVFSWAGVLLFLQAREPCCACALGGCSSHFAGARCACAERVLLSARALRGGEWVIWQACVQI